MRKIAVKRSVSALMAFLMAAILVLGVNMGSLTQAFAATTTKKLKDGDFIVELDKNCSATNVSVDVKSASQGFHDFVKGSYVYNYLDYMYGNNGLSGIVNLTDKDGNKVEYTGTIKVTYTLPDDWNLNYGVKVLNVSGATLGDYKYLSGSVADSSLDLGNNTRTVSFSMEYSNTEEICENYTSRFVIMQNLNATDIKSLSDGVYDINISMLSDVNSGSLSMAAITVDRNAKIIINNSQIYLNVNFNMGVVYTLPAFANKIYSVDLTKKGNASTPLYGKTVSGVVNTYYTNEEARNFAFSTMKNGYQGLSMSDEEIWSNINETVLQNGIKAIHNATLNVTNSVQDNGTLLIGFCSDIMDSLYDGAYGSDAGYNTTNILVGNPVKTDEAAEAYTKTNSSVDKTELETVFEQFINKSDTANIFRNIYTEDTYNTYYIPAWQKIYQAYSYCDATQEQINEAVKDGKTSLSKLESITMTKNDNISWQIKNLIKKANKIDGSLYTSASYKRMVAAVTEGQSLLDRITEGKEVYCTEGVEKYNSLEAAYSELALLATDYTALENAVNEAKKIDVTEYTEKTVKVFEDTLKAAENMLADKDSSDTEIEEQIKALYAAEAALSTYDVVEDGIYKADVTMLKTNRKDPSMAGGAINKTIKIEVVNGEYYATIDFKGMTITNKYGYLSKLWYYADGYTYDKYGEPEGKLEDAEVLSTQKNEDGSDVIDIYNDSDNLYPDLVRIKIGKTALSDSEGYLPLRVMVPIMEAIATGNGEHNVLMKINWDSLTKTTEDDPDIQPETPVEQSPAVDAVDSATGVKVHADKGVFEAGVKLVVNPITAGDIYNKAANSLADIGNKFRLYEVHFDNTQGQEVQPNGTVTVYYPVPEGYDVNNLALYRINEDGTKTLVKGVVEDGYYKVVTKSFSTYALVEKGSTVTTDDTSDSPASGNEAGSVTDVATGDVNNLVLWMMLLGISLGAGAATVAVKRRRSIGE